MVRPRWRQCTAHGLLYSLLYGPLYGLLYGRGKGG